MNIEKARFRSRFGTSFSLGKTADYGTFQVDGTSWCLAAQPIPLDEVYIM